MMDILEQGAEIYKDEEFWGRGLQVCDCGGFMDCVSDVEEEETGVHDYTWRCRECGLEDYERY